MTKKGFPARPSSEDFVFKKYQKIVETGKIPEMREEELRNFYKWLIRMLDEETYERSRVINVGIRTFLGNEDFFHLKLFLEHAGKDSIVELKKLVEAGLINPGELLENDAFLPYILPVMADLEKERLLLYKNELEQLLNKVYGKTLSYLLEILYKIEPEKVKTKLKAMLFDWDPEVRKTAVKILKKNPDEDIKELFKRLMIEEEDPEIKEMLREVLG
jgi:hypothetical protein